MINPFQHLMLRKANRELVEIVHHGAGQYSQEALIAAHLELEKRQLTDAELTRIISDIDQELSSKEYQIEKTISIKSSVKDKDDHSLDIEEPILSNRDKTILKVIIAYLIYLSLITLISNYRVLLPRYLSIYSIETILFLSILGVSIFGLIRKKRAGFLITLGYFSFSLVATIMILIGSMKEYYSYKEASKILHSFQLELLESNSSSEYQSIFIIIKSIINIVLFYAALSFLNKQNMLKAFDIAKSQKKASYIIGISLGLIMYGAYFFI